MAGFRCFHSCASRFHHEHEVFQKLILSVSLRDRGEKVFLGWSDLWILWDKENEDGPRNKTVALRLFR